MHRHQISRAVFAAILSAMTAALLGCAAQSRTQVSEFQQDLITDGVTDSEYREAFDAAARCMDEHGWEVSDIRLDSDGLRLTANIQKKQSTTGSGTQSAQEEGVEFTKVSKECRSEYLDEVEYEYILAHTLTGSERDAEMQALIDCLQQPWNGVTGVQTTDDETQVRTKILDQLANTPALGTALTCLEQHARVFPPVKPD